MALFFFSALSSFLSQWVDCGRAQFRERHLHPFRYNYNNTALHEHTHSSLYTHTDIATLWNGEKVAQIVRCFNFFVPFLSSFSLLSRRRLFLLFSMFVYVCVSSLFLFFLLFFIHFAFAIFCAQQRCAKRLRQQRSRCRRTVCFAVPLPR